MSRWLCRHSEHLQRKPWVTLLGIFLAVGVFVIVRLPLYLNAEHLLWSDEAANLLTVKHLFTYKEPYFFYHGMRYQGLTESLLALPAVFFFGFTALAQKLAGSIVYLAFAAVSLKFLFSNTHSPRLRAIATLFAILPTTHLYYCSFMAYGGHLLNALLGYLLLLFVYRSHQRKSTPHWQYPITVCLILVLGLYTYRQFLIFYPALLLFVLFFRGGLGIDSRKNFRNLAVIFGAACVLPSAIEKLGYAIQNSTYETLNSFITFHSFALNAIQGILKQFKFVFGQLVPVLFFTPIEGRFRLLGVLAPVLALVVLIAVLWRTRRDCSDLVRLFQLSFIHIAIVIGSVVCTPYATTPMDVRYLMPIYAVLPFIAAALFSYSERFADRPGFESVVVASYVVIALFIGNTIAFNNLTGIMHGLRTQVVQHPYHELIHYLDSQKIQCIYMDYPDAYRLSLISNESIRASGTHFPRIRRYEDCASKEVPRILVLRNNNEELPLFLDFRVKKALKYEVRKKIGGFTVLESTTEAPKAVDG